MESNNGSKPARLEYDVPVEVSEKAYRTMMNKCSGLIAGREDAGRFYIKIWMMKYRSYTESLLKALEP